MFLSERQRAAIRQRRTRRMMTGTLVERATEWFSKQRAFYEDPSRLVAALCGRRAGKTRGGCLAMLIEAASTPNGRFLYLNETRGECHKLAWHGLRGDGMYSLAMSLKLPCVFNATDLTIHFPDSDSWIYLMGADDEAGVRKALGLAYHLVWWDEAQKIPSKLEPVIRSVLMPTLIDYGGRLRLTGTPVRTMSGLFYNVTRGDGEALRKWSVHRWTLLDNPHFGRAVQRDAIDELSPGQWDVVAKDGKRVAGPFASESDAGEAVAAERFRGGLQDLQEIAGELEALSLDSPYMRREGFGEWVHEDAHYVYDVHKVLRKHLTYAPARWKSVVLRVPRLNGETVEIEEICLPKFLDIERAIEDLPGRPSRDYWFGLAADIGFTDPFAVSLAAWSLKDPALYEVGSWGESHLDQPTQAAILRLICDTVNVGVVAADAGGSTLATVKGWSREWASRYGIPLDEMEKTNKPSAIAACNGDLLRGHYRLRDRAPGDTKDPPLLYQMSRVQWLQLKTGTGRLVEDPSIPNDVVDAGLYVHRRSFAHRYRPEDPKPQPGTPEWDAQEERRIEDDMDGEMEVRDYWH